MNEDNVLGELSATLDRLNGRLDTMAKGDLPPFMEDKKDDDAPEDKKTDKKDDEDMPDDKEEKMYGQGHDMEKKSDGYSDVITSEYLNWMENTLKSQGVDISGARTHFDDVAKANLGSTPEQFPVEQLSGQTSNREQEGGNPSTGAVGKINSGKVAKGYLAPSDVSASDIEAAYEVYKAAALEEQFKANLGTVFSDRLAKEVSAESEARAASQFDARTPLANIEKALSDLSERIDGINTTPAESTIRKANNDSTVEIPSTEELGNMDWDDVHRLAGSVWQ